MEEITFSELKQNCNQTYFGGTTLERFDPSDYTKLTSYFFNGDFLKQIILERNARPKNRSNTEECCFLLLFSVEKNSKGKHSIQSSEFFFLKLPRTRRLMRPHIAEPLVP